MGTTISTEHSEEELAALKEAEDAVLKHFNLQEKVKELKLPLRPPEHSKGAVNKVRILQFGPDNGEPVLFIHGGGGSPSDFASLMPPLERLAPKNKYRFLLVERPGSGSSDPYDFSECEAVDEFYVQFLSSVLEALKINGKVHLVGNSMGGCIIFWFAHAFPEKVKSFSFVGVPVCFTTMKFPFNFYILKSWVGKQMMARPPPRSLTVDLFENHFYSDMEKVPAVTIDYLWTSQKTRNNSLSFQSLLARVMPSWLGWGGPAPCAWKLESLEDLAKKFPCQFIVGSKENHLADTEQQECIGRYLGGKRSVIGQGHLPWIEDPDGVAMELVELWNPTMPMSE